MASLMEIDAEKNFSMGSVGAGNLTVSLHPLVIMNVSEHWTRITAQNGQPSQVLGALIGKQKGRHIEIMNSFELLFQMVEGDISIDRDYYNTKEQQFKQVFSNLEFLGWYKTSEILSEDDIKIHQQICQINENPVLLKLNPLYKGSELPVNIYESVIDLIDKETKIRLVELPYILTTEEAERIGVEHVARVSTNHNGEASIASHHLMTQYSAVKMLGTRVKLILNYIKDMSQGKVKKNDEILREVNSLCHRVPLVTSSLFNYDLNTQQNDVVLMAYLGTLTKTCQTLNQYVTKFSVLNDRHLSRRMRGLMY